ncbi:hypothetical protein D9M68_511560 [compost metagenome]
MEFLAEGHRHGVLQLGTAHLQYVGELFALGGEGADQALEAGQQGVVAQQQAETDGGGVGVVGGLRHVHVVVRVQVLVLTLLLAHGLEGDVGDHLVGVHVGGGAGATLDHVHHELVVEVATDQAGAGLADGGVLVGIEVAELLVGIGGGLLDHGQGDDQLRVVRQRHAGQAEVVYRAQGLDAVVGLGGNFEGAEQVFFDAEGCSGGHDAIHLWENTASAAMPNNLGL